MTAPTTAYSYVRFSDESQAKGDGLRRQLAATDNACKEHNWTLDPTLKLRDLGVSAFKGKNAEEGALAGFLDAVKNGTIKKGSVLVVESLDRLSRDEILTALALFTGILAKGVSVYTMMDRRLYTYESVNQNPTDLIVSITVLMRAHEESATKSKRISAAWEQKRLNASTTPMTSNCVGWISLINGQLQLNEHAATMRRIVQMALDGMGCANIVKKLNTDKTPVMSCRRKTTTWAHTSVMTMLRNRALIGELQPCRIVDGRQQPEGEVVKNYFPALLTETEFYSLQSALARRAGTTRQGRTGHNVANLFGRLLHDGHDGGTMQLTSHHADSLLMVSVNSRKGLSPTRSFSYAAFEWHFLQWVAEVKISTGRESMSNAIEAKLSMTRQKIDQLNSAMDTADPSTFPRLIERMKKLEMDERDQVAELEKEKTLAHGVDVDPAEISRLGNQMRTMADGAEKTLLRSRIKQAIAGAVENIDVWVSAKKMTRLAICDVQLKGGGLHRVFYLVTQRGHAPVSQSHNMPLLRSSPIDFGKIGEAMIAHAPDVQAILKSAMTSTVAVAAGSAAA